jgi:hypothetical protein
VITSAAVIMVAVFSVFVLTGVPSIKQLGLGNAVAIALDASLVRLILVPAAMQLMGRWNWWLPGWLDRILPHIGLEGPVPSAHGTVQLPAQGRAGDSRAGHAGVRGGGGGNGDPGLPERVDGSDRVGEYVGS